MARIQRDLFLCYGFWHPYYYLNIAIGNEFRVPFLEPVFFALFPDEKKLMRRAELHHNVTLFSWMRLAYAGLGKSFWYSQATIGEIQAKRRFSWAENAYRSTSDCFLLCLFH